MPLSWEELVEPGPAHCQSDTFASRPDTHSKTPLGPFWSSTTAYLPPMTVAVVNLKEVTGASLLVEVEVAAAGPSEEAAIAPKSLPPADTALVDPEGGATLPTALVEFEWLSAAWLLLSSTDDAFEADELDIDATEGADWAACEGAELLLTISLVALDML